MLVGSLVAAASAFSGVVACGGEASATCLGLVRSLAIRVGLFSAGMTVLMLLLVAGLLRMAVKDEERRTLPGGGAPASVWAEHW